MSHPIDARGLSCPQPVLMTLEAMASGTQKELNILVDNEASKENVVRAAENKGWTVFQVQENGPETAIWIRKG